MVEHRVYRMILGPGYIGSSPVFTIEFYPGIAEADLALGLGLRDTGLNPVIRTNFISRSRITLVSKTD